MSEQLLRTALAAAAFALIFPAHLPAAGPARTGQVLSEGWLVKQLEPGEHDVARLTREASSPDSTWFRTSVPAQVHDVLFAHGRIPDPHVGRNAAASTWVAEKDWAYACKFATPPTSGGPVLLRFAGLDTLAAAYLNGAPIGSFANMYREFSVDVRKQLAPAGRENVLLVVFSSPVRFIDQVKQPPEHVKVIPKHKYLRKSHSDFSSYLGASPNSIKVGIFGGVRLETLGRAWIEDVWVRPRLAPGFKSAKVEVAVESGGEPAAIRWTVEDPNGRRVASGSARAAGSAAAGIDVPNPMLWWPRTHGTPHLYRLRLDLEHGGAVVETRNVNFGIRDVRIVLTDPVTGEKRFRFDVNGKPVFMRGACWAPVEGMTQCWRPERARALLELAESGHMNILRVWGEGYTPPQEFYDECDRRGIFVWQDFMFGYGMHPTGEPGFDENCRLEIEGMIRALRNHPSILLWVGGNENHMGIDFAGTKTSVGKGLFDRIMPEAVAKLDPDRHFHPSSPFGGPVPNWPLEGDWHDYSTLTFSPESLVPTFASEVGRASAPSLASMKRFLSPEELWPAGYDPAVRVPGRPAWPPMWQYRSVGGSWDKVGPVEQYPDPATAEDLVRVLGTAHGEYLRQRVERERRGVPDGAPDGNRRCWGNMVWRLNDAWPIIYWSVIDYYLEPKIPYYFLRRAYEPVLVSIERTADRLFAWVVNDSPEPVSGRLVVKRIRFDGRERGELAAEVTIAPGQSRRCLDLTEFGPVSLREEFLHASFAGRDATFLLIGERYLHLPKAKLTARAEGNRLKIATDVFARQVSIEADSAGAVFGDNFFDLAPGQAREIEVKGAAAGALSVRALNGERVRPAP